MSHKNGTFLKHMTSPNADTEKTGVKFYSSRELFVYVPFTPVIYYQFSLDLIFLPIIINLGMSNSNTLPTHYLVNANYMTLGIVFQLKASHSPSFSSLSF